MCALNVTGVVGMQAYARTSTDPLTFSQVPPHVYNAVLAPTTMPLVRVCTTSHTLDFNSEFELAFECRRRKCKSGETDGHAVHAACGFDGCHWCRRLDMHGLQSRDIQRFSWCVLQARPLLS